MHVKIRELTGGFIPDPVATYPRGSLVVRRVSSVEIGRVALDLQESTQG